MAQIKMSSGFTVCPEGVHIFRIYKVDYDQDFGKLTIHLVNAQGITHTERFSLISNNGEVNEKACNAFSFFAKTALNDFSLEAIDHNDLVNHYIKAEVVHTVAPNRNDPSKNVTFANLSNKWVADGFDTTPVARALTLGTGAEQPKVAPTNPAPTTNSAPTKGLDLDKLLG